MSFVHAALKPGGSEATPQMVLTLDSLCSTAVLVEPKSDMGDLVVGDSSDTSSSVRITGEHEEQTSECDLDGRLVSKGQRLQNKVFVSTDCSTEHSESDSDAEVLSRSVRRLVLQSAHFCPRQAPSNPVVRQRSGSYDSSEETEALSRSVRRLVLREARYCPRGEQHLQLSCPPQEESDGATL
mmetsp:Transcript_75513/g.149282  ORF Transcript_75513/g.149282 Transcript_75513/m.149282 type:complete len:183 (-) Transcript_75513:179-727(-)